MNRPGMTTKTARKGDARMPFEAQMDNMLSGYLYPQLHKDMQRIKTPVRKQKDRHE